MAASRKTSGLEQYLLRGKLRVEGFERWRYSFCGVSRFTGSEKRFFIEMYLVNPSVSPNVAVIAQKTRTFVGETEVDVQNALVGGSSYGGRYSGQDIVVKPSYVLIKAGVFGAGGKQMNSFVASSHLDYTRSSASFRAGGCEFSAEALVGSVSVSASDIRVRPEILCNEGTMEWDLRYDRKEMCREQEVLFGNSMYSWVPLGIGTMFSGRVVLDGEEYSVEPMKSFGFIDKSWGQKFGDSYFHLSSGRITSIITGKPLEKSFFSVDGEFGSKKCLSGVISIGEWKFKLGGLLCCMGGMKERHDCIQVPANESAEKLHWTICVEQGNTVLDLDVFCDTSEMFVRSYELPQRNRELMQILGGGTGVGEIRIYKKVGGNLELLEHAKFVDTICEFGQNDTSAQ